MRSSKLSATLLLSALSLAFLSSGFSPEHGRRGLANCLDAMPEIFPQENIISQIKDGALRASAMSYYQFLSRVEASAIADSQYARASYGLDRSLPTVGSAMFSSANFNLAENPFGATGHLWGSLPGASAPGLSLAGSSIQPAPGSVLFNGTIPAASFGVNGQNNPRINLN